MKKTDLIFFIFLIFIIVLLVFLLFYLRTAGARCLINPIGYASNITGNNCYCLKIPKF